MNHPTRLLFVCTGNICRSPTAEGVARAMAQRMGLADRFEFDSAGTHGYHVGEPPDPRSIAAARKRGYDLSALRARRVANANFHDFDYLLALDSGHLDWLSVNCPPTHRTRLKLLLDFSDTNDAQGGKDVPDPYYGDGDGFERVLDLIESASRRLIETLASADRPR